MVSPSLTHLKATQFLTAKQLLPPPIMSECVQDMLHPIRTTRRSIQARSARKLSSLAALWIHFMPTSHALYSSLCFSNIALQIKRLSDFSVGMVSPIWHMLLIPFEQVPTVNFILPIVLAGQPCEGLPYKPRHTFKNSNQCMTCRIQTRN